MMNHNNACFKVDLSTLILELNPYNPRKEAPIYGLAEGITGMCPLGGRERLKDIVPLGLHTPLGEALLHQLLGAAQHVTTGEEVGEGPMWS